MKRFHIHLNVQDLAASVAFYSRLFAAPPTRVEADYAKWMLDDPRVNFAISTRGGAPGLDHLGFQADGPAELDELRQRAESADLAWLDEGETSCCYAQSTKHWVTDPQGVAWEHFHTLADIPVFSQKAAAPAEPAESVAVDQGAAQASACCAPRAPGRPVAIPVKSSSSCC